MSRRRGAVLRPRAAADSRRCAEHRRDEAQQGRQGDALCGHVEPQGAEHEPDHLRASRCCWPSRALSLTAARTGPAPAERHGHAALRGRAQGRAAEAQGPLITARFRRTSRARVRCEIHVPLQAWVRRSPTQRVTWEATGKTWGERVRSRAARRVVGYDGGGSHHRESVYVRVGVKEGTRALEVQSREEASWVGGCGCERR